MRSVDARREAGDTVVATADAESADGPWELVVGGVRVRAWRGRSPGTAAPEDLRVLSGRELERFHSFRDPAAAAWYAGAHASMRHRVGLLLGTAPERVEFGRSPCPGCGETAHGKPVITAPETSLQLSLSRSGPYWLCAVAEGAAVGADIERLRPRYAPGLFEAVLSTPELARLAARPADARAAEFTRHWTRKEAVVKASGIGVATDLRRVQVRTDLPVALVQHQGAPSGPAAWFVWDLPAGPDFLSALAVPAALPG
ncbi:4'-phosphopantetheinyl transferase superfamily protein [Streptomyces sp. CNQ085]|uniref:4'-phosphopantetheinyl transferase family protein n=1 Tax=Streptomyces sp. CNQ085 TaxID=2886944 RepID=UPI001F50AA74|nr:4'-phosphopantetheinyl transferase superfamily protein [Streptomyces sp. CNQ085]MCI0385834.1 4'-phosphopantetheinyl transferase superfamily protein [Streptomyces sp. CNQ085]